MARFDVHRYGRANGVPYLLNIQSHHFDHLPTRIAVPLVPASQFRRPLTRLYPAFDIEDTRHVLVTTDLGGIDVRMLGPVVGSFADRHHDIVNAVDLLLQGF